MFIELKFGNTRKLVNLENVKQFCLGNHGFATLVYREGGMLDLEETYEDIKRMLRNCGEFTPE